MVFFLYALVSECVSVIFTKKYERLRKNIIEVITDFIPNMLRRMLQQI
jgi:hypothetical protein